MNTNRSLKHRNPMTGTSSLSTLGDIACNLHKAVGAASAAAIIGFAVVGAAYADPAIRAPTATVELAGYELPPRGYQCVPIFHGKYTGWRCEYRSAEGTGKAIAKAP